MRFIEAHFRKTSSFSKNIFEIFKGAFVAQFLLIMFSPVLSRIYSVEQYGNLAIFTSLCGIVGSIATLKFELAIATSPNLRSSVSSGILSLVSSFVISFVLILIIYVFTPDLLPFNSCYIYIMAFIQAFLIGVNASLNQLISKLEEYKLLSVSNVLLSVFNISLSFLFIVAFKSIGLILAYVFSYLLTSLLILRSLLNVYNIKKVTFLKFLNDLSLKKECYEKRKFPLYLAPSSLISIFTLYGIPIVLEFLFSTYVVGIYSLSMRFTSLPLIVVGSAIGNVFRVESAKYYNDELLLMPLFLSTLKKMLIVSIPIFIVLVLLAPYLFSVFFGAKWVDSGKLAQILAVYCLLIFIVTPLYNIYIVMQLQRRYLFQQFIQFVLLIFVFISVYCWKLNFTDMFKLYSMLLSIFLMITIFDVYKLIYRYDQKIKTKL